MCCDSGGMKMQDNNGDWWMSRRMRRRRVRRLLRQGGVTVLLGAFVVALAVLLWKMKNPLWTVSGGFVAGLYFLSVCVFAGWLFYVFSAIFRTAFVRALVFVGLFVWGSIAYFLMPVDAFNRERTIPERLVEAPNRTLAAFFPSRGGFEQIGEKGSRVHYYIFHSVVIFYIASLMFALFGRGTVNRMWRLLVDGRRLNVFWGVTPASLLLADDIICSTLDQEVLFCLPGVTQMSKDEMKKTTFRLDRMGANWYLTDVQESDDDGVSSRLSVDDCNLVPADSMLCKGDRHYFFAESGHANVRNADRLVRLLVDRRQKWMKRLRHAHWRALVRIWKRVRNYPSVMEKPRFFVRVEASEDREVYLRWAASVLNVVSAVIVQESELIAKRFIEQHPVLDAPGIAVGSNCEVSGEFKALLLGFGAVGREVLNQMVCNGQFKGMSGFSVDIVEKDESAVFSFEKRHDEAMENYRLVFVRRPAGKLLAVDGLGFGAFLRERDAETGKCRLETYNRIVISLPGDARNLTVANLLLEFMRKEGMSMPDGVIFARVSNPARARYVREDGKIALFGNLKDVYSNNSFGSDAEDEMAKVLHGKWANSQNEGARSRAWRNANWDERRSSLASAAGERNLLRLLGMKAVPKEFEGDVIAKDEFEKLLLPNLRTLAEDEHLRWNAYHRMLGLSCWDLKNPPMEKVSVLKANQTKTFRQHADLVPFDRLPDVDLAFARAKGDDRCSREDFTGFDGEGKPRIKEGNGPKPTQSFDIEFCQAMFETAAAAGMKLIRI